MTTTIENENAAFVCELMRRKRATLEGLLARLEVQERARAEKDAWKLDKASFDEFFPVEALRPEITSILESLGRKFGVPLGASLASMFTASNGFLGLHKARVVLNPRDTEEFINPGISSIHVGGSGNSKSEISKFILAPIRAYNAAAIEQTNDARTRKRAIQKELEQLYNGENFSDDDDAKTNAQKLELELLLLENNGACYIADFVSIESLTAQIYTNSLQARIEGRPQPGFILAKQDAAPILNAADRKDVKNACDLFSRFNNLLDGGVDLGTPATRKTQGKATRNGIAAYFEIQTELFKSLACRDLRANGFLNRFLYVYYPETTAATLERKTTLGQARDDWARIIRYIHDFNGGAFYCAPCDDLETYIERLDDLATKASDDGNLPKYAFCKKLFFIVYQIALALHVWNLVLNNDPLDDASTVDLDGVSVPRWAVIPADTITAAIRICEYYRETRDMIWNIVLDAVSPKVATRRRGDDLYDDDLDAPLPCKMQEVYHYALENGIKIDLLQNGDGLGRVISKKQLRDAKNYYKNPANQAVFEEKLKRRFLLFDLPRTGGRDAGGRFFLPDDLTPQQIREYLAQVYATTAEGR